MIQKEKEAKPPARKLEVPILILIAAVTLRDSSILLSYVPRKVSLVAMKIRA